jgi:hypothetical protein
MDWCHLRSRKRSPVKLLRDPSRDERILHDTSVYTTLSLWVTRDISGEYTGTSGIQFILNEILFFSSFSSKEKEKYVGPDIFPPL